MFGKIVAVFKKAWLGIANVFSKAVAFIKAHPYMIALATVPIRPIMGDMDFSDITDLLLELLPVILLVSVFGSLIAMFRKLGDRLGRQ